MFEKGEKEVKYWNAVKQVITGLCLLFVFVVAAGLVQPSNAFAQEGWGPGQDTWKFELGGYFPSTNTELQVSGIDSGNDLDLEDKLGFSDNDAIFRLDGYWRFFKKHRLGFGYYQFTKAFGLRIGYDYFRIDVTATDGELISDIVYEYQGVQAYGILRF